MEKNLSLSKEEFCSALTLRREIDDKGTVRWFNRDGKYHRNDGPAIEYQDGSKEYYLNGERHRVDGPAVEGADESKLWYFNGKVVDPFYRNIL